MGIKKSVLAIMLSAFFVLIGCDADINFDRALNVYDEDANLLTNIAGEVEFDSVLIATTTSEVFTIENIGSSELNLLGEPIVEITSEGDLVFSVTAMPETTIKPGKSTTFEIEFAPTVSKYYEATVTIVSNDKDMSPLTFTISGTGLEPGINVKQGEIYVPNNTGNYDFGNFRVLETTSEVTFTIENSGTYELNLDGTTMIEITGADAGLFTLNDSALSSPVAPGASTTFTLSFTPDSEGLKTATVTIVNDDFNKASYVFTVKGTGVQPEINVMQGSTNFVSGADSFDFIGVRVSESSSEIVFTIENLGTADLLLSGSPKISIEGSDASHFVVNQTMTVSPVSPSNSTLFEISFCPTSVGKKTATISIANDDNNENPYTFTVTGKTTTFDFNGDGYDDVIVGADADDDGGTSSGCAFIFLDNSNPSSAIDAANANVRLIGVSLGDHFGYSVSSAGDVNGDGYDDVIVGAPYDDDGGSSSGCAFIFVGYSMLPQNIRASNAEVRLSGNDSYDYFGHSVSGGN